MQGSLPLEKSIREFIQAFLLAPLVTKRELLFLLEHLSFALRIIQQGRSFIIIIINMINNVLHVYSIFLSTQSVLQMEGGISNVISMIQCLDEA